MPIPTAQLLADRDRRFADLGETIAFRTVSQEFDPQTLEAEETVEEVELEAIVGAEPMPPTPGTAGAAATGRLFVLVKDEDRPAGAPSNENRIVRGGLEYDVIASARSADGLTWELECRRR